MNSPHGAGTMVQTHPPVSSDLFYPESDGQPMAENTIQYRWIVCLTENLRHLLVDQAAFVGADLFWYPVEGSPGIVMAPDVIVALGRPSGDRGSYKQWEEGNIPPQVVFEIVSPGNTVEEILKKEQFYTRYGVLEIFFYKPETMDFWGLVRQDPQDPPTLLFPLNLPWKSPTLGIHFVMESEGLAVFYPDGGRFEDPQTWLTGWNQTAQERDQAVQERDQTAQERDRAVQERDQAAQERDRAWERLRQLGIDPSQL